MSRKGKLPIPLPKDVSVSVEQQMVTVKGPKGTSTLKTIPAIQVDVQNNEVKVALGDRYSEQTNFLGLFRSLIFNMVEGTSKGFAKQLEMIGVGYRASVQGELLDLQIGLSHPTKIRIPQGIDVKVEKNTLIHINGIDKQQVGQFAAKVRAKRPPEPYQGKGIRYKNEYVRKKAGKAGSKK